MDKLDYLKEEDYVEQDCLLCMNEEKVKGRVEIGRILDKADEYYSQNDYDGALRHLLYWLKEAESLGDKRGCFSLHNELMGHYRKRGDEKNAVYHAEKALELIDALGLTQSVSAGTCYVNAATVYKAFSYPEKSLHLFEKAVKLYENLNAPLDKKAGLYNNMGLTLTDLKRFDEAVVSYQKALYLTKKIPDGSLETAITYLNMASLVEERDGKDGTELILNYVDKAKINIEQTSHAKDGYYAFVCEKCASSFGYWGDTAYQKELEKRAKEIYERN